MVTQAEFFGASYHNFARVQLTSMLIQMMEIFLGLSKLAMLYQREYREFRVLFHCFSICHTASGKVEQPPVLTLVHQAT